MLSMEQAAKALECTPNKVYSWARKHPEYFKFTPIGKNRRIEIAPEDLERLLRFKSQPKAKGRRPAAAPLDEVPPPEPPAPLELARKGTVRVRRVGWWCKRCGDLMPSFRLVCRCLWAIENDGEAAASRHRDRYWLPAHVDLEMTVPGGAG